jgi:hypothetical protein
MLLKYMLIVQSAPPAIKEYANLIYGLLYCYYNLQLIYQCLSFKLPASID